MGSRNEVEETRVWINYSNIHSKHYSKTIVREVFSSKVEFHKKPQLMWTNHSFHRYNWCHVIDTIIQLNTECTTELYWAIPCPFSGSDQVTLSNFPEIILKLSLTHVINICKMWMKSVQTWH